MAGHSRSKNGVAEFTLGLAEGKTRGLAYVPAIHVSLVESQQRVPYAQADAPLEVASAAKPRLARTRADPASQTLGMTNARVP